MTKPENIISFFVFEQVLLDHNSLYKILLYCGSKRDCENWTLTIEDGWVNGYCNGDTGKFYEFLCGVGLAEKVEIVRG